MTLGNMRANGVRSLDVCCWVCHHRAIMSADPWSDDVPVPSFGPRMVLRDHRRRRAAELTGTAAAREPDRRAMAVTTSARRRRAGSVVELPRLAAQGIWRSVRIVRIDVVGRFPCYQSGGAGDESASRMAAERLSAVRSGATALSVIVVRSPMSAVWTRPVRHPPYLLCPMGLALEWMDDLAADPHTDRLERVHCSCRHGDYQVRRSRDHIEARDLPATGRSR
jgi:hypothetical protein